jgi:formate/nitrite transporter FocA (FNT family)
VTAQRIVIQLRSSEVMKAAADTKRIQAINKLNRRMILNAVTRGLFIILAILFLVPAIALYPEPQVALAAITVFVTQLDSAARIYLFSVPKK